MKKMPIKMKLLSDAIFGSGFSVPGDADIFPQVDDKGFPYMKGSTFKGVFRETLESYLMWQGMDENEILQKISGKITPAFSWPEDADFLERGSGFCVLQDGLPAAWAFSAAVSENEVDIGVETDERFRRRGFAFAAAAAMIADTLLQGKTPVWACHAGNSGSQRLAEALGFVRCGECETVRVIT